MSLLQVSADKRSATAIVGRDAVGFALPNVVDRSLVVLAGLRADGYTPEAVTSGQRPPDGPRSALDRQAVSLAALGLAARDIPGYVRRTLRQHARDVIDYGERVQTDLYDLGHHDLHDLAREVEAWVVGSLHAESEAAQEELAGFPGRPAPGNDARP